MHACKQEFQYLGVLQRQLVLVVVRQLVAKQLDLLEGAGQRLAQSLVLLRNLEHEFLVGRFLLLHLGHLRNIIVITNNNNLKSRCTTSAQPQSMIVIKRADTLSKFEEEYIYIYTYIYIHTHTHTYIHTCIHTYIQSYREEPELKNKDYEEDMRIKKIPSLYMFTYIQAKCALIFVRTYCKHANAKVNNRVIVSGYM
jgi:hypothetical protein